MEPKDSGWIRFEPKLPWAIIVTLVLQALGIVVWAAQLDARVRQLEVVDENRRDVVEKIARLEERIVGLQTNVGEIKMHVDGISQQLHVRQ